MPPVAQCASEGPDPVARVRHASENGGVLGTPWQSSGLGLALWTVAWTHALRLCRFSVIVDVVTFVKLTHVLTSRCLKDLR